MDVPKKRKDRTMRKPARKIVAACIAIPLLFAGMGTAHAAEANPTYVGAELESSSDGTGFGTPAQTFVNGGNGFTPGDNTPDDGVVSSGDTVEYKERLTFDPAPARTVTTSFDLSSAPMLEYDENGTECPSAGAVSATKTDMGCRFEIPAGAAGNATVTFRLKAKDTGGKAMKGQKPRMTATRTGGATDKHDMPSLTVVSTANADLYLDNGSYSGNERVLAGDTQGYFDLKVKAKGWGGYSTTHGASAKARYSGTIDVSAFPEGTVWKLDGNPMTVNDGRIRVDNLTGDHRLSYMNLDPPQNKETTYDIHIDLDKTSFNGEHDPGSDAARGHDTYDAATGVQGGRPYPNDNWSRVVVTNGPTVSDRNPVFLGVGAKQGETMFDTDNMRLTEGTPVEYRSGMVTVSTGSAVRVRNTFARTDGTQIIAWGDDGVSYAGNLKAFGADGSETTSYKAEYGSDCSMKECRSWSDKPDGSTRAIRIQGTGDTGLSAMQFDLKASDRVGYTQVGATGVGVKRVEPGVWSLTANASASAETVKPSDDAAFAFDATMNGVPTASAPLSATADVCLPDGLRNLAVEANGWTVEPTASKGGCAKSYRLTLTDTTYRIDNGTDSILPTIRLRGMTGVTAEGIQSPSVTWHVHTDAYEKVAENSMTLSSSAQTTIKAWEGHSNIIRGESARQAGTGKWTRVTTDVGGTTSFEWSVYNRDKTMTGTVETVIKLPEAGSRWSQTGDCAIPGKNGTGPEGSWKGYDRECSTLDGTLAEPVGVTDGNATVEYSTGKALLDPDEYGSWLTWDRIPEAERAKITAIRVTTPVENGMAGATGTVKVRLPEAKTGTANAWIGASYLNGKPLSDTPWGDGVKTGYATLSSGIFLDVNRDGKRQNGEYAGSGDSMGFTVWKSDEDGARNEELTCGSYCPQLGSGWYHVEATGFHPDSKNDRNSGTLGYTTGHYGLADKPTATTQTSWTVHLNAGQARTIYMGYYRPDHKASVTQNSKTDCGEDSCTIVTNTTVTNKGTDPIGAKDSTLHMRLDGTGDVKTEQVTSEIRFKEMWYGGSYPATGHASLAALDEQGETWAAEWSNTTSSWNWNHVTVFDRYDVQSLTTLMDGKYIAAILKDGTIRIAKYGSDGGWWPDGFASGYVAKGDTVELTPPKGTRFTAMYGGRNANSGDIAMLCDDGGMYYLDNPPYHSASGTGTDYEASPLVRVSASDGSNPHLNRMQGLAYGSVAVWDSDGNPYVYTGRSSSTYNARLLTGGTPADSGKLTPMRLPDGAPATVTQAETLSNGSSIVMLDGDGRAWGYSTQSGNGEWNLLSGTAKVKAILGATDAYEQNGDPITGSHPLWFLDKDGRLWRYMNANSYKYCSADPANTGCGNIPAQSGANPVAESGTYMSFTTVAGFGNSYGTAAMLDGNGHIWLVGCNRYDGITDITPTDHSGNVGGLYASDITPTAKRAEDGGTRLDFALPYRLDRNDAIAIRTTRIIDRGSADRNAGVQSWFDSPETPYAGTPVRVNGRYGYDKGKNATPDNPDLSKLDAATGVIDGNPTCITGEGTHTFTNGTTVGGEDSCEQTGGRIPARATPGQPVRGMVRGVMWNDANGNGLRDIEEKDMLSGRTVTLYHEDGTRVATTVTGGDGSYRFDNLPAGEYRVWFPHTMRERFTDPDRNDPDVTGDGSADDSDASVAVFDYGRSTVLIRIDSGHVSYPHVDAGVRTVRWIPSLPSTGLPAFLLLAVVLVAAGGYVGWRRMGRGMTE